MNVKVILAILRMLYGVLFVASAVLKLFPIDYFELILVNQVGLPWTVVPLFGRLIILFEFALGAAILAGWKIRLSLLSSLLMLVVFSIYLIGQIIAGQGAEDCGCFGELIPLDGPASLIKNAVFIIIGGVLYWKSKQAQKWTLWPVGPALIVLSIPALFLILPLPDFEPDADFQLDAEILVRNDPYPAQPIDEDERLVVIMLAKCVHCAQLGTLISTLEPTDVEDKLRIIILGKSDQVKFFLDKTGLDKFHYGHSADSELVRAIEGKFPTAVLIKNGQFVNKWKGSAVNIGLLTEQLGLE